VIKTIFTAKANKKGGIKIKMLMARNLKGCDFGGNRPCSYGSF